MKSEEEVLRTTREPSHPHHGEAAEAEMKGSGGSEMGEDALMEWEPDADLPHTALNFGS